MSDPFEGLPPEGSNLHDFYEEGKHKSPASAARASISRSSSSSSTTILPPKKRGRPKKQPVEDHEAPPQVLPTKKKQRRHVAPGLLPPLPKQVFNLPTPKKMREFKLQGTLHEPPPPTGKNKSVQLHQKLLSNTTYLQLRAYFRHPKISKILEKEGCRATPEQLRKMTSESRELLLCQVEEALDHHTNAGMVDQSARTALQALEDIVHHKTRFKVSGTVAKCFEDDKWILLYDRAKIRAGLGLAPFDPLTEVLLKTAQVAYEQHDMNKYKSHGVDLNEKVDIDLNSSSLKPSKK